MPVTIVQQEYGQTTESPPNTYHHTLGSVPTVGNTLVAAFMSHTNAAYPGTMPAGWVHHEVAHVVALGGQAKLVTIWTKTVDAFDTALVTIDFPVSGQFFQYQIQELAGVGSVDTSDIQEQEFDAGGLGISLTPTAGIDGRIISAFAWDGPHSTAVFGGLVIDSETGVGPPAWIMGHLDVTDATGSYQPGFTSTGFHKGAAVSIFLSLTPVPPPPVTPPSICVIDDETFDEVSEITSDDLVDLKVRIELQGTGSGQVVINRYSPVADEDNIKKGNWLCVVIPQIQDDPIGTERGPSLLPSEGCRRGAVRASRGRLDSPARGETG